MLTSLSRESSHSSSQPVLVSIVSTARNRAALSIALVVLLAGLLLSPFVSGLFGALALYVIARAPYQRFARRLPAGLSAALIIVLLHVLVIVPLLWFVIQLIDEAPRAMAAAQPSNLLASLSQLTIGGVAIGRQISNASGAIVSWVSEQLLNVMGSAQVAIINIMISTFGLYYLLTGAGLWESVREYIPFSTQTADTLRDRFVATTEATILGSGVIVLVQGVLIGFAFWITGLPNPLFWGAMALLAAILPLIGSTLVWGPAAILLVSQHRYVAAAVMAIIGGGIAGNASHLLRPLLFRRMTNIHPMITLVGALAGLRVFGLMGVLLGPLTIALVFELLRFFREEYTV